MTVSVTGVLALLAPVLTAPFLAVYVVTAPVLMAPLVATPELVPRSTDKTRLPPLEDPVLEVPVVTDPVAIACGGGPVPGLTDKIERDNSVSRSSCSMSNPFGISVLVTQ